MPTEKQKTCPHPPELIVILPDNITICNHCYGLLDENLKLQEEEISPLKLSRHKNRALPECDPAPGNRSKAATGRE